MTVNRRAEILVDYLRLLRLPNVFTALADVAMGFLFVHRSLEPLGLFLCLAATSAALYCAGMVLNDVWDVEQDRRERPWRPIAAGRISVERGRAVGLWLLLTGVVLGWIAGGWAASLGASPLRAGLLATGLALCVLLYDGWLKRTPAGPLAMGACRLGNVLLGMSVVASPASPPAFAGWGLDQWLAAAGLGVYVTGITWFGRTEAAASSRLRLAAATLIMLSGIAMLGLIHRYLPPGAPRTLAHEGPWLLLLGLIGLTIARRCAVAIAQPAPRPVQLAVKNAIWSLIVLNAAVALLVSTPLWSLVVLSLILPTIILGRWIAST